MGLYLGLMSGTSMDAIDAPLVDFDAAPLHVVAFNATAFDPSLTRRIASLIESANHAEPRRTLERSMDLSHRSGQTCSYE